MAQPKVTKTGIEAKRSGAALPSQRFLTPASRRTALEGLVQERAPSQAKGGCVALKQKQKNDILRILAEAGVHRELEWVHVERLERPRPVKFHSGTMVAKVTGTHWYLAISPSREAWWAPSSQVSTWRLQGKNFQQLLTDVVRPWAKELKRELDEPGLWWPESKAEECQHRLLPHQQNEIYNALRSASVHFDSARWQGAGDHTLLSISNYSLTLTWSLEASTQTHLWSGSRSPGSELPLEEFQVRGWENLVPLIHVWAKDLAEEQREKALIQLPASPSAESRPARLVELRLNGIRSFHDFRFSFRHPDGQPRLTTLLIGENGSGKTTLLRALALALCPRSDAEVLLSSPLGSILGQESNQGTIEVDFVEPGSELKTRKLEIVRKGTREEVLQEWGEPPSLFAYGTGAGRAVEGASVPNSKEFRRYQSVQSLFDYSTPQANPELVLRRLRDQRPSEFPQILEAWRKALGLEETARIELSDEEGVQVRIGQKKPVPLRSLADGYRLTLSWLLDLFAWASAAGQPHVADLQGLILIDEIERHLHPKLQASFLHRLQATYPAVQIIATTHSPLTALGAHTGELFVSRAENGRTRVTQGPTMEGLSVEDLVTSEQAFDAEAYPPETADLLKEYDRLSLIDKRTDQEKERLRELSRLLSEAFSSS